MGCSQDSGANDFFDNTVLPCNGHSCLHRYQTPQLLMRLLQPPWLPMSAFICRIEGFTWGLQLLCLAFLASLLYCFALWSYFLYPFNYHVFCNFAQVVRSSDFDIRWWIRYLHEYQEDGCEDFTSAVDTMRAAPGFVYPYSCVCLASLITSFIFS